MVLRLAGLLALTACLPAPRGRCAVDADCAGGFAGSFCSDGVCQSPARVHVDSALPAMASRRSTATVRAHVERPHGAVAAQLALGSGAVAGTQESPGAFRFDVPLLLAPADVEGPVAFSISATDDLGQAGAAQGNLLVDDRAPRLSVDPASVPSAAVVRGTVVSLRVAAADLTAVTISASIGTVAALSGTAFEIKVDTAQVAPQAAAVQVLITATDAVGNATSLTIAFPLTRVRWSAQSTSGITGLALSHSSVLVTGVEAFVIDRLSGATKTVPLGQHSLGDAVTDDTNLISTRIDNQVCKVGLDGAFKWCCGNIGALRAGPALYGAFVIIAGSGSTTTGGQRLYAIPDTPVCNWQASNLLADFNLAVPSIATDGTIYSGAYQAVIAAHFDGTSWPDAKVTPASGTLLGAPALQSPGVLEQRILLVHPSGALDTYSFPSNPFSSPASLVSSRQVSSGADFQITPATIAEDGTAVVAVPADQRVVAIRPDGTQRWSIQLPSAPSTPPTQGAGGVVYVGAADGTLTALSISDGAVLWSYRANGSIQTPPAAGCDGTLYFATDAGQVVALVTDTVGLAASSWPRAGHDVRGTGDARRPLRSASGGCLE